MQDFSELLEFELDAVAGGNPFSISGLTISISAFSSTVSTAVATSFDNDAAAEVMAAINQGVSISGP